MHDCSIALLGSGGAGVVTTGQLILTLAARHGLYGMMNKSYGPQIRGGESAALLRLSSQPVYCAPDEFDLLLALDWNNAQRFADEIPLAGDAVVVCDDDGTVRPAFAAAAATCRLPLRALCKALDDGRANMIATGWLTRWMNIEFDLLAALIDEHFGAKGANVVGASQRAARAGFDAFNGQTPPMALAPAQTERPRWMLSGNEAAGYGALRGGVRFVAAYPITPASDLLEYLAPRIEQLGGGLLQSEDELASINALIGAAWGGVPALTATSGPGLALMTESLGLAVASETPLVVVDVQRGGPSTGIPTKSEQTDLDIALHGLHGDAPHLVTAPLHTSDAALTVQWTVHLAEALQVPAIVLSDQFLGQSTAIVDAPAEMPYRAARLGPDTPQHGTYQRYAVTADGRSPMAVPGKPGGMYTADGLEHEPGGRPSSAAHDHHTQLDKRQRKLDAYDFGDLACHVEGDGDTALVCWGSVYGACHEARLRLEQAGTPVRVIVPRLLAPLPVAALHDALADVAQVVVVEQSHRGQFLRHLRAELNGLDAMLLALPGPLPVRAGDIVRCIAQTRNAA